MTDNRHRVALIARLSGRRQAREPGINTSCACGTPIDKLSGLPCLRGILPGVFLFIAVVFLCNGVALGEGVIRLPTVMPAGEPYEGILVSNPDITAEPVPLPPVGPLLDGPLLDGSLLDESEPELPPGARQGVFQWLKLRATWLSKGNSGPEALGATELQISGMFGFPFPRRETPLLITPGFAVHYLNGPVTPDLPPRVFDSYVQFQHMRKLSPRWGMQLAVTPGVYSDFEQSSDEAFRMSGHFGAMYNCTDRFDIVLGVAYLPYQTWRVMPFAGIVWRPNDDWKFQLTVPKPMIAKRVYWFSPRAAGMYCDDTCVNPITDWCYIAGELGGGSWAVRRLSGVDDVVTYQDLRFVLGFERENFEGLDYHAEIAYVFCRKFIYDSDTPDIKPGDAVMLRVGTKF